MFSSKQSIQSLDTIPPHWIFQYYLNISPDSFNKSIRIKSAFNPNDKTPSMFVYYDKVGSKWLFKCHSTGNFGDGITLVKKLFNLSFNDATEKILNDYMNYDEKNLVEINYDNLNNKKWIVQNLKLRNWTKADANYWLEYNIGSSLLKKYNVKPIESYDLCQLDTTTNETVRCLNFDNLGLSYGYFTFTDELYKIYNPKNKSQKFISLEPVIQGIDQLSNHETMIITKSLKDIMAIKSLGFKVDCIAPPSETSKLKPEIIDQWLKKEYKYVIVYMDSDIAGINAMKYYEDTHNLPFVYLPKEKDISDVIKNHGKKDALCELYPKVQNAIDKYIQKNL
jgi:hypothetical protein